MAKKEQANQISARNSAIDQEVRPPVIVVMGHIDHGKSTLLDYIRKTNVVDSEAGGITQHLSAYEVIRKNKDNKEEKMTFLDTPGHAAFTQMRERGAQVADIAILIVSAEDGVKPQTIEAKKTIESSGLPYIVAINKIDKPGANIEKTKTELAENEIYLENYGGNVPFAAISAKTGEGIDELLSLISIMAEMENLTANPKKNATGFVIEANLDTKCGIQATLVIKDGTLRKGMLVAVGDSACTTRMMKDFRGKSIEEASFSAPISLSGFDKMPKIGETFEAFDSKNAALEYKKIHQELEPTCPTNNENHDGKKIIPLVLKTDVSGSLEAIEKEIEKIVADNALFRVIHKGQGKMCESDIKVLGGCENGIAIGFNVKADKNALELAERQNTTVEFFDIIYKLTEWLEEELDKRRPKVETEIITGSAKILKTFSKTKERQVVGGKVTEGTIEHNGKIKILRRDTEIGKGKIVELQKNKAKTNSANAEEEFGMMIEAKVEIAPGDTLQSFRIEKK